MERPLLAQLAKNTMTVAPGEMEPTLSGLNCQGKEFKFLSIYYFRIFFSKIIQ